MMYERRTKIIATLGPASSTPEMIKKLFIAGANVFRLNFSHGTHEHHKKTASIIRTIEQELERPVAIMMDLQGPKIRIGVFEDGSVSLKSGSKFILDLEKEFGNCRRINLPHPEIFNALKTGTDLLLDDGRIKLRVLDNDGKKIETEVIEGGILSNKKGVNIPNVILPITALTEKDKKDIAIVDDINADWLAVSFVQTAEDILYARSFVNDKVNILAKIEKPSAVKNIDSILEVSDAIMVARGDLGVEIPFEQVPGIQNQLINKAKQHRKPVVVATQMLESMTKCHVPTRAEVSDISSAIRDGADAIMLSAESASGDYPEESVKVMAKVARQVELDFQCLDDNIPNKEFQTPMAISAWSAVKFGSIKYIAAFTETGRTAINVSNTRPSADIIALTPNMKTLRKLCLVWGVKTILIEEIYSFSQIVQIVQKRLCDYCSLENKEKVVVVAGIPFRVSGTSNLLHICETESVNLKDEKA